MESRDIIKLGNCCQVGIAVHDADKVAEAWTSLFGFSNWHTTERGGIDAKGRPWKVKLVISTFGGMDFELIQPVEGRIVQSRFLETHGEGIHHIAFPVADIPTAAAQIENRPGVNVVFKGGPYYYEIPGGVIIEYSGRRSL